MSASRQNGENGENTRHLHMRQMILDVLLSREGDALDTNEVAYLMPWVGRHARFECRAHCVGDDDGSPFGYVTGCSRTIHTVLGPLHDSQILGHLVTLMNQALVIRYMPSAGGRPQWAAAAMAPAALWNSAPCANDLDEIAYRRHRLRTPRRCPPRVASARC